MMRMWVLLLLVVTPVHASDLDQDMATFRKDVLEINKRLLLMEEELLFPADTQLAIFVSLDVGNFFVPDSITLTLDGETIESHLYTDKEVEALKNGAVQKIHTTNIKNGVHQLTAFVTGKGPNGRDYRRGATLDFEKAHGRHYIQLKMEDDAAAQQPVFNFKSWK